MFVQSSMVSFYYSKIVKSLNRLEYSYEKVKNLPTNPEALSDAEFEIWDGFSTRFSRTADIFLSKFIKAAITEDDPGFDGKFRDYLNRAEKLLLIDDVNSWLDIRGLRNVIVHEYSDADLEKIFKKMLKHTPLLIDLRKRLATYAT